MATESTGKKLPTVLTTKMLQKTSTSPPIHIHTKAKQKHETMAYFSLLPHGVKCIIFKYEVSRVR